jgi:polysaccharide biosynthesis transport protein
MTPSLKKGFDVAGFVSQMLTYARHGRLMVAAACLGILAGLVYYVYTIPLYEARGLVYVRSHGSPVSNSDVPETVEAKGLSQALMSEFTSKRNLIETAKSMKLIGAGGTWADVVESIPLISVSPLDSSHIEVTVQARQPEVLRTFIGSLVNEFQKQQQTSWQQYRDEALDRYAAELKVLQEKARDGLKQLSNFEREEKISEASMQQTRLNELPKNLILTRELVQKMDVLALKMAARPGTGTNPPQEIPLPQVIEELSLLATFEKEKDVKIGDVIRRPSLGGTSPLMSVGAPKLSAEVIVQPGMVESLQPWQKLEKERRIMEDRQLELSNQYLPGHVVMKKITEDMEANERALRVELSTHRERFALEHENYRAKLVTYEAQLSDYHKLNEQLSFNTQAYADIEKEKALWDKAREHLAEKLAVVTFSEQRNWVEMAFKGHTTLRDEIPVSPNKTKLVMMAVMLALGLSIGSATLVNLFDGTASTLQQLESVTGVKGIGIVPHTDRQLLEDICRSPSIGAKVPNYLLENFRLMRSHILLYPGASKRHQVVMVTSARPSEGKTSIASNLAWAFQSMGARTLLIDCDLRRGRVHTFTKLPNDLGMTNLLQGNCTANEAIEKTNSPLLDVIPRGPIAIGTTDLLVQAVFWNLIDKMRGEYDQIILDTPPVLGLSETSSLQKAVDGVIMVVRAEKTYCKDVADAATLLRKSGAHFYGLVLNDLDLSRASNYYNYYYYSSSYYDELERPSEGPEVQVY